MYSKFTLQKKLFTTYSILICIIIICLTVIFYIYLSNVLSQSSKKVLKQASDKICSQLDSEIREIDKLATQVMGNKEIQSIMIKALEYSNGNNNYFNIFTDDGEDIRRQLVAINSPIVIARRICIFNTPLNYISVGTVSQDPIKVNLNINSLPWLDIVNERFGRSVILPTHMDDWLGDSDKEPVISLARSLVDTYQSHRILGVIEVQQPYRLVEEICKTDDIKNSRVIVLDNSGNVVYPIDKLTEQEIIYYHSLTPTLAKSNGLILKNEFTGKNELVYAANSEYSHWSTILTQPESDLLAPVYFIQKILYLFGLFVILVTLALIYIITKRLAAPIKTLTQSIKEVSLQSCSLNLEDHMQHNEVQQLNQAFNEMVDRLKKSMDQVVQSKSSEMHAHLLALQAQINPHFIFNTLMGVSSLGQEAGNTKISSVCSSLAEMMRYSASFKNSLIPMKEEVRHAGNYLRLCKFRYEDDLDFIFSIDNSMNNIMVPKLILQPIIENSFSHGFNAKRPPWQIKVIGYVEEDKWKLEIWDNGSGLEESLINQVMDKIGKYRENIRSDKFLNTLELGGMGLINIFIRLNLIYRDDVVFKMCNIPGGKGFKVIIGGTVNYQKAEGEL